MIIAHVIGVYPLSDEVITYELIDNGKLDDYIDELEARGFELLSVQYMEEK